MVLQSRSFLRTAERKITAVQEALPVMERVHLVDKYAAVLPAVIGEIGLRIAIDIGSRTIRRPGSGDFQTAVRMVLPFHVAWKTNIY
jgi:hypothetical protein